MKNHNLRSKVAYILVISMILNLVGFYPLDRVLNIPESWGFTTNAKQLEIGTPSTATASSSDAKQLISNMILPDNEEDHIIVPKGTIKAMLPLPSQLTVVVDGEEEELTNLEWECKGGYNPEQEDIYVFTLVLPREYKLGPGVELLEVAVYVGENLITAFDEENQTPLIVLLGTAEEELTLPTELSVIIGVDGSETTAVTWNCGAGYEKDEAGIYEFTPVLSEEFTIASTITAPVVQVEVKDPYKPVTMASAVQPTITLAMTSQYMWKNDITIGVNFSAGVPTTNLMGVINMYLKTNDNSPVPDADFSTYQVVSAQQSVTGNKINITLEHDKIMTLKVGATYDIKVQFISTNPDEFTDVTKEQPIAFKVSPGELETRSTSKLVASGTYGDKIEQLVFSGGVAYIKGTKQEVKGHWIWRLSEEQKNVIPGCNDKNTYSVSFVLDGTEKDSNYVNNLNQMITPVIAQKELFWASADLVEKRYTGTVDGAVTQIYLKKDKDSSQSFTPEQLNLTSSDYKIAVTYSNGEAGSGKSANVTLTLGTIATSAGSNYKISTKTLVINNVSILKSYLEPTLNSKMVTYNIYEGIGTNPITIKLDDLFKLSTPNSIPSGKLGAVTTTYTASSSNCIEVMGIDEKSHVLTIRPKASTPKDSSDDVVIKFETGNFTNTTAVLKFQTMDKRTPFTTGISYTGSLYYNQSLADAAASTSAKLVISGKFYDVTDVKTEVKGTLQWLDDKMKYNAGIQEVGWKFIPFDPKYTTVTGVVSIDVKKRIAHESPGWSDEVPTTQETAYPYGTMLQDIKFKNPHWSFVPSANRPPVTSGTAAKYDAIFTPADPNNYESLIMKVAVTIVKATPDTIVAPEATGIYGDLITACKFTDNTGEVLFNGERIAGKWAWSGDIDKAEVPVVEGTKRFLAVFTPTDSKSYNTVTAQVLPVIEPCQLDSIKTATLKPKTYNASAIGEVNEITCVSNKNKTIKLNPEDYTAVVVYDNHNAGKGRSATVTIKPASINYRFSELFINLKNLTIFPADFTPDVKPDELEYFVTLDEKVATKTTFDLKQFMPQSPEGQTTGDITYAIDPVSSNVGICKLDIKTGIITITGNKWTPNTTIRDDKIKVTVSCENFKPGNAVLYIKATRKIVPVLGQGEVVSYTSKIGTGQPLSRLKLNQNTIFVDPKGNTVPGALSWLKEDQTFETGKHSAVWVFTPEDQTKYESIKGAVLIDVVDENYMVTVVGGSGSGNYAEGAIVDITAQFPADYKFIKWTSADDVTFAFATNISTTFVMPAKAVTIHAETVQKKKSLVTVKDGTGGGTYEEGVKVSVTANKIANKFFTGWTADPEVQLDDPKAETTTFIMPENPVTITATYSDVPPIPKYSATVTNGTGGGSYEQGNTVTIKANTIANKKFSGWTTSDGVVFADATKETTTFVMPGKNVTVTANYTNVDNGGGGNGGGGNGGGSNGGGSNGGGGNGGSGGSGGGSGGVGTVVSGSKTSNSYIIPGPDQWVLDVNGWRFKDANGRFIANEWKCIYSGDAFYWYYFGPNTYMVTGWQSISYYTYFLEPVSGNNIGHMITGWYLIDGKWYFFDPKPGITNGALIKNATTPDGYIVGADGVWIQ